MRCDEVTAASFQETSPLHKINASILVKLMRQQNLQYHSWWTSPSSLFNHFRFFRMPSRIRNEGASDGLKPQLRPLLNVCLQYMKARCQDRRVNVFVLHNLAADCCRKATPVNYTHSRQREVLPVLLIIILESTILSQQTCGENRN